SIDSSRTGEANKDSLNNGYNQLLFDAQITAITSCCLMPILRVHRSTSIAPATSPASLLVICISIATTPEAKRVDKVSVSRPQPPLMCKLVQVFMSAVDSQLLHQTLT